MPEEKGSPPLADKQAEARAELWEREFCIDIDEIEIEFDGQTPRLTSRIEINLEASDDATLVTPDNT